MPPSLMPPSLMPPSSTPHPSTYAPFATLPPPRLPHMTFPHAFPHSPCRYPDSVVSNAKASIHALHESGAEAWLDRRRACSPLVRPGVIATYYTRIAERDDKQVSSQP